MKHRAKILSKGFRWTGMEKWLFVVENLDGFIIKIKYMNNFTNF